MTGALLLLDVDGPLNPWAGPAGERPDGYVEHRFRVSRWRRKRLRAWLNPGHGAELLKVAERTGAGLVWATAWGHRANTMVGPAIGLPELPVIEFAGAHSVDTPTWKYPAVARYAYGRALAWLDDDFDLHPEARDAFVAKRAAKGTDTLLVKVNPKAGMTGADLESIEGWLGSL